MGTTGDVPRPPTGGMSVPNSSAAVAIPAQASRADGASTLGGRLRARCNNFDSLRLAAALLVIFSHSYGILYGSTAREPFNRLSRGFTLGEVAVAVFFVISGMLVARSFLSEPSAGAFLRKRCLRIFPGLIVCTLACVLGVGLWFTTVSVHEYFWGPERASTWKFLGGALMYPGSYELPGVFEDHPNGCVNGSLWTLPVEFFMYVGVLVLGVGRCLTRASVIAILVALLAFDLFCYGRATAAIALLARNKLWIEGVCRFGFLFFCGTLMLLFKDHIRLSWAWLLPALAAVAAAIGIGLDRRPAFFLFGAGLAYVVVYLGFVRVPALPAITRWGDFSYGVYLYAFPVQQIVYHASKGKLSPGAFAAISAALTLPLAVASWFLIERPFLRFKGKTLHVPSRDNRPSADAPEPDDKFPRLAKEKAVRSVA